jgi:hypothetical protein
MCVHFVEEGYIYITYPCQVHISVLWEKFSRYAYVHIFYILWSSGKKIELFSQRLNQCRLFSSWRNKYTGVLNFHPFAAYTLTAEVLCYVQPF